MFCHKYVCVPHIFMVPTKVRKKVLDLPEMEYKRCLSTTTWVPGIEPESSIKAASALNC